MPGNIFLHPFWAWHVLALSQGYALGYTLAPLRGLFRADFMRWISIQEEWRESFKPDSSKIDRGNVPSGKNPQLANLRRRLSLQELRR